MNSSTELINPTTLIMLGLILFLMILFILYKFYSNVRLLNSRKHEQINRLQHLKLRKMLRHLDIPFSRYLRKTSDLDKERHIWACEQCTKPDECIKLLNGEEVELDISQICPNHHRLKNLTHSSTD